ncbi:sugar phosphate nucleotidyltransferase [Nodularia sp. NIES-3585]|uniref:sugar phosphate nucleotidyltransferase n=1 Tax=Nodularia sp. NIES-3585 TaxID=1973477 RepID=UPI000B5CFACD|nr:sugar phosphate nucleotidyltransferase [Nodularia sp. NIES-3585]GAX34922.1 nucleotidyl transferase [Nodularia sp. NIES-3585]
MRAVLMAGGSGTRLRPLTCDLPKPMVPILNRPIAEHIINLLKRHQITEVIATLHYLPDVLRDYFQDGSDFGVQMTYAVEEDQPLGTAGCVKNIEELLDETFLVISGDSITDFDLTGAIAFHKQKQAKATLVLTRVPNPVEFGVVITDEQGHINRFLEKPSSSEIFSDTVNTGIYILEPEVLDYLPSNTESDFSKDLFPLMLEKGEALYGYIAKGYWCDVGHLDAYREAQYDALDRKVKLDFAYKEVSPDLWIGQNTFIAPTATIETPAVIGDNCRIGARVQIEGGTIIGDNVTIGADANLKRPILWNGSIIGDEAHLSACVISRGTRVDRRAHVLEAAVVGSLSTIGEEAQISPNVRVWPSKKIESGAILNINLIWGNTAQRNLFGQRGVQGLANIDITPEFAVKLGAAYGSTLRTKANPTALMEAAQKNSNVVLGGSGETGFIFPHLHPGFDSMFCIAKLIEMLTIQERSLATARSELPRVVHKSYTVRCPWTAKGALMRYLVETHPAQNLELIDGVKICQPYDDSWLLVLPDASEPLVHLYANSNDRDWVDETLRNYRTRVQTFVERQQEQQPAEV